MPFSTPVLLPGKSHGQRSLVGWSPWGREESDTTEPLHFHFSLSCIGEGNDNPLQHSCLENPRDGRAWWAALYGVAQSWTRLKRLSSSSSSIHIHIYMYIYNMKHLHLHSSLSFKTNKNFHSILSTTRDKDCMYFDHSRKFTYLQKFSYINGSGKMFLFLVLILSS